jgi:hypothetical protein
MVRFLSVPITSGTFTNRPKPVHDAEVAPNDAREIVTVLPVPLLRPLLDYFGPDTTLAAYASVVIDPERTGAEGGARS